MTTFAEFLKRNSVTTAERLPLIHTTRSYNINSIMKNHKINATKCDVFTSDLLNYFFVGRPAYKFDGDTSEAEYWELPCCFIFDFQSVSSIKRIFPFDSGAFRRGLYPNYIGKMNWEDFEVSTVPNAPERIVGAFFGNINSYFKLKPKDTLHFESEFSLGVFDAELRALHKLSCQGSAKTFDDRRFTIEVQSDQDIDLTVVRPLAVIAPVTYFDNQTFRDHVEKVWKAKAISYNMYTLSIAAYYGFIYAAVEELYKEMGLL